MHDSSNFVGSERTWVLLLFLPIVDVTPMSLIGSVSVVDILNVFWKVCLSCGKVLCMLRNSNARHNRSFVNETLLAVVDGVLSALGSDGKLEK